MGRKILVAAPPIGQPPAAQAPATQAAVTCILDELGIVGLESVEPIILAALIQQDPLLLVGAHGTGKSYLLNRLAEALNLEHRHYNASLVNFDDLVGYPLPNVQHPVSSLQGGARCTRFRLNRN